MSHSATFRVLDGKLVTGAERVAAQAAWLKAFHRGDCRVLENCYRSYFKTVKAAVGGVLSEADQETVIHDIFSKLIASAEVRAAFRGGSFRAWITTVARDSARDYHRRLAQASQLSGEELAAAADREADVEGKLIGRFVRDVLPPAWRGVFDLRFLKLRTQRDAARELGMTRITLAYRERRIRSLLRAFLIGGSAAHG